MLLHTLPNHWIGQPLVGYMDFLVTDEFLAALLGSGGNHAV
jgi:hypothetical protein